MFTLRPQLALLLVLMAGLAACGETARLQIAEGTGPQPKLPEPNKTLMPTVNIAPAVGWAKGAKPVAAPGTQVAAFAEDLDHPRWLYVLPTAMYWSPKPTRPPSPMTARAFGAGS